MRSHVHTPAHAQIDLGEPKKVCPDRMHLPQTTRVKQGVVFKASYW